MSDQDLTQYTSYDYLEAGRDYKAFDLAPEIDPQHQYTVPVSEQEEARVQGLLQDHLVISLHDHPSILTADPHQAVDYARQGRERTGFAALRHSGLDAIFDNLMDGTATITSKAGWKWTDVIHDLGMRLCDIRHQDFLVPCGSLSEIRQAKAAGKLAWIASMESATPVENELDRLEILYGFGVRCMGVAYSEANALGAGLKEPVDGGLTRFGRAAVERMNKIGLAIDVSHSGDQTALDTIRCSSQPVFITHAGARAVWDSPRMKPDEVLVACAGRGGVIGLEAAPHTTLSPAHPQHSIDSVMDHFQYLVDLVGMDHVTFGPDTLFGDHAALHQVFSSQLSTGEGHGQQAYEPVAFVRGLENPAECYPNIVRWLVKNGYSDDDIAKVTGGNTVRVLEQVWI